MNIKYILYDRSYILTLIISLLIAYFLLCNRIHINKEITQYVQPKVLQTKPKEYQTEITTQKQKDMLAYQEDLKIKVKSKKTINKIINIKDTTDKTVTKINDSTFTIRIEQIDSFLFTLKDNNIKVIVQDTNTKIIDLIASKKPKRNYNKVYFISGIITTILVIFLVK